MRGRIHSALAAGALLLLSAPAGAASFEMEVVDGAAPTDPWMKAIGDLDGDGKLDLVIMARNGPVVWYENPSWTRRTLSSDTGSAGSSNGIAIGDLDGNGSPDVALANGIWFANPRPAGDAKTDPWPRRDIDSAIAHDVFLSDLDGDEALDLVKRNQGASGDVIRVFRQGSGGQWSERTLSVEAGEGLALGDLDRDGDDDIVVRGRWYENDGDPISGDWTQHTYTNAYTHPHVVVKLADVDGDDRLDVVLSPAEAAGGSYRLSWFEAPANPESPSWTEHELVPNVETVVHALVATDFDKDGRTDVAYAEMHQGSDPDLVRVLFQKSAGSFTGEDIGTQASHSLAVGDLNGDGRPDLMGANWNSTAADGAPVRVWWNRTTGGGGGGGGGGGSPDAVCAKRILRAAGLRCRRDLQCHAKGVKGADAAPCLGASTARLGESLAALSAKEPGCAEETAAAEASAPAAHAASEALVGELLTGADVATKPGRKLHTKLLRGVGTLCDGALGAHAKDAKDADPAKLEESLASGRERFLTKSGKALERAAEGGVTYAGPAPGTLADTIDALVADFVASLSPPAESF